MTDDGQGNYYNFGQISAGDTRLTGVEYQDTFSSRHGDSILKLDGATGSDLSHVWTPLTAGSGYKFIESDPSGSIYAYLTLVGSNQFLGQTVGDNIGRKGIILKFDDLWSAINETRKEVADAMWVYPIPVARGEDVKVVFNQNQTQAQLYLLDMNGLIVRRVQVLGSEEKNVISTLNLASGTYVLLYLTDATYQSQKKIIQ